MQQDRDGPCSAIRSTSALELHSSHCVADFVMRCLSRRARIVADEYVVATEGSASPELPLEPVSLRLRHRHGSYEDQAGEDTWIQLQLDAELLNL